MMDRDLKKRNLSHSQVEKRLQVAMLRRFDKKYLFKIGFPFFVAEAFTC